MSGLDRLIQPGKEGDERRWMRRMSKLWILRAGRDGGAMAAREAWRQIIAQDIEVSILEDIQKDKMSIPRKSSTWIFIFDEVDDEVGITSLHFGHKDSLSRVQPCMKCKSLCYLCLTLPLKSANAIEELVKGQSPA